MKITTAEPKVAHQNSAACAIFVILRTGSDRRMAKWEKGQSENVVGRPKELAEERAAACLPRAPWMKASQAGIHGRHLPGAGMERTQVQAVDASGSEG